MCLPVLQSEAAETAGVDWARLIPGEMPCSEAAGRSRRIGEAIGIRSRQRSETSGGCRRAAGECIGVAVPRSAAEPDGVEMGAVDGRGLCVGGAELAVGGRPGAAAGAVSPGAVVRVCGRAPISLLGIALLHAALITLLGYTEGLHAEGSDLRQQARILGKSVLWATAVLCLPMDCRALRGRSAACSAERACCTSARCGTGAGRTGGRAAAQRNAGVRERADRGSGRSGTARGFVCRASILKPGERYAGFWMTIGRWATG